MRCPGPTAPGLQSGRVVRGVVGERLRMAFPAFRAGLRSDEASHLSTDDCHTYTATMAGAL